MAEYGILYRIKRLIVSFVDRFIMKVEDPIAVLEFEYQEDLKRLARARDGLAHTAGLVRKVERQVKENQERVDDLTANIQAALAAGEEEYAGQLALELEEVQHQLSLNVDQLEDHRKAYQAGLETIKEAQRAMDDKRRRNEQLKAGLKMAEADRLLAQIQTEFSELQVAAGDQRTVERIQQKIDQAAGQRKVAADLSGQTAESIKDRQRQRKARANIALQKFKAQMGLPQPEAGRAGTGEDVQKTMGPRQKEES